MFACAVIGKRVKILEEEENWQQCIALAGRRLGCDCAASLGFKTGLPMSSSISLGSGEQGQVTGVRLYVDPPGAEGEAAEGPHCVHWAGRPLHHCSHHSGQLPALHWAQPAADSRKLNGRRSAAATTAEPPSRRDVRAEGGRQAPGLNLNVNITHQLLRR